MDEMSGHEGHNVEYLEKTFNVYEVEWRNGRPRVNLRDADLGEVLENHMYCNDCDEYVIWEYEDVMWL